jgi:LPXTG-motif cell wall-anchored protein
MPPGYDPVRQVEINALLKVSVPRFQWPALALLALLLTGGWLWWRRRK